MAEEGQQQPIWERRDGEPNNWFARFLSFKQLGPSRTLMAVIHSEEAKKGKTKQSKSPPGAWSQACEQWEWRQRAEAWDTYEQKRIEAQRQAYVDAIMSEGYALVYERIKALGDMAKTIDWSMRDPESKEYNAKWIDADKINQWRGVLDDIAKELGQRVKVSKQEITGRDGGAIEVKTTPVDYSVYTDEQLEQLKALALKQQEAQADEQG